MNSKMSSLQIMVLSYLIVISTGMGITSHMILSASRTDAYITIFLGFLIGLIPVLIFLYIINYEPSLNIFEKNLKLFNKKIGTIINTILVGTIFYMAMICFWSLNDFITSQYLTKTPKFIISIAFIIPMVYLLSKNMTILCRTSFVIFIISLFLVLLTIFGLFWQVDLSNIMPVLENGIGHPLKNSLQQVTYNSLSIILITMIPKNNIIDKKNLNKRIIIGYTFANMVIFIMVFLIISVLGIELANIYQYPEYTLLKKVKLFGFLDRTESTLSLRWIFYLFTVTAICLTFIKEYLKTTFNIKNKNFTTFVISIIAILTLVFSNKIFDNNTIANRFIETKLVFILFITTFLIPVIISIKIKKDKKSYLIKT